MQAADLLPTIAEISITLAGFTGILAAMQSFAQGANADQSHRIVLVLAVPAIVLCCSALPFVLSDFSTSPSIVGECHSAATPC